MTTTDQRSRTQETLFSEGRRWEEPAILMERELVATARNGGAAQDPFIGPLGFYGAPTLEGTESGS